MTAIPEPGPWVLPALTLGAIWVILWRDRVRWLGVLPVVLAFGLWAQAGRPLLLVSGDGKLLGLAMAEGRALSVARGGGFAAESWLENDGDLASQDRAAERDGFTGPRGERWFQIGDVTGVALSGKGALAKLDASCASGALVVIAEVVDEGGNAAPKGCRLIDLATLRATGPLAFWADGTGLRIVTTKGTARIWSGPARAYVLPDLQPPA